ncbi:MAG: META domain-containing protein [Burkholderiales bacterium]|jgi:heat shock protein HslJ|nr:META domain-containing protein [Burkholderiales bacterium]
MKTFDFPLSTAVPAAALVALLTACTPATSEKEQTPPPPVASPSQASAVPAPAALPLQQTVWGWQYTRQSGAQLASVTPARYTLTFLEEGRLAVTADCNRGGTAYRIQDNQMTFELIAMTKMLCTADSLDRDFLDGLHAVERYRIDDKTLTLQLRQGGEMVFVPVQP